MKKRFAFLILLGIILISFVFINSRPEGSLTESEYQQIFQKKYSVFSLTLPGNLEFAGEDVPLDLFDVRESLDQELLINTYWQSQTLLFIKRANKYFPEIEKVLNQNGIPDDFKYLVLAPRLDMRVIISELTKL